MVKIRSRALNKDERFCCSKKDIKRIFNDNEITVSFGQYGERNFDDSNKFYKGPKLKGKIIATLGILNNDAGIGTDNAIISFYVLKETEFSEDLRQEFILKILPKMYDEYLVHKDGNPEKISGVYYFRVELFNDKFLIHKGIES